LYEIAPEICVEVCSPANSSEQLAQKKALYFDAGAQEVWICELDGSMVFFTRERSGKPVAESEFCPAFPATIPLD
jgi:Uma2 family endonuclease